MKPGIFTSWLVKLSDGIESKAHYKLANALMKQGDLKAAIASYYSALHLNPSYPEAHLNLGNALKKQGDLKAESPPTIPLFNSNQTTQKLTTTSVLLSRSRVI